MMSNRYESCPQEKPCTIETIGAFTVCDTCDKVFIDGTEVMKPDDPLVRLINEEANDE